MREKQGVNKKDNLSENGMDSDQLLVLALLH